MGFFLNILQVCDYEVLYLFTTVIAILCLKAFENCRCHIISWLCLFFFFRKIFFGRLRVRCTINRSHSTPCKKAEFEHLKIFPGHCLDFFLSVSGKICHSPIKKVKRQPTLIISFSQHSPFFWEQSKNSG